jgi:hypothetical protein
MDDYFRDWSSGTAGAADKMVVNAVYAIVTGGREEGLHMKELWRNFNYNWENCRP